MHKVGLMIMAVIVLLFACAPVTHYPIHVRYAPEGEGGQAQTALTGQMVTVTRFIDKRGLDAIVKQFLLSLHTESPRSGSLRPLRRISLTRDIPFEGKTPGGIVNCIP
jgi:hypothetical protein